MATGDVTAKIRTDGYSDDVTIEGRAAWLGNCQLDFGTFTVYGSGNGTFTDGETLTQTGTSAVAYVSGASQGGGATITVKMDPRSERPTKTGAWTGGTSGKVWTPTRRPIPTVTDSAISYVVTSEGYSSVGALTTLERTVHGTKLLRTPVGTKEIPGTISGTFTDGETITQAGSGATGKVFGAGQTTTSAALLYNTETGTPNGSGVWTGGSSSATMTPSGAPASRAWDERSVDGNLVLRVCRNSYVYNDDKNGGAGTSGTNPKLTAAAGWASSGGNSSNAATDVDCTNNSTLDYPPIICQWDEIGGVCTANRVESSYRISMHAFHLYGVAAIVYTATGQSSSHAETSTVSSRSRTQRSGSTLYAWAYTSGLIPLAGNTQGELIDIRAQVYPKIGDADSVWDTDTSTDPDNEPLLRNKATIKCDKTGAAIAYAYVDLVGGNDGTGVVSNTYATALASPYQHIGPAYEDGANVIRIKESQSHPAVGTAPASRVANTHWARVEPSPGHSSSDTIVTLSTTTTYKAARLEYYGVKVRITSTASYLDGEDANNFLRFHSCLFDNNSVGAMSVPPGYRTNLVRFHNCIGDLGPTLWNLRGFSTSRVGYSYDGTVIIDSSGGQMDSVYGSVAGSYSGNFIVRENANNAGPSPDGLIFAYNKGLSLNGAGDTFWFGDAFSTTLGFAWVNNIMECITANKALLVAAADSSSTKNHNHWLVVDSGFPGGRINHCYDDTGSTTPARTNFGLSGNAGGGYAIKSDTFVTQNAARVSNWGIMNGVCCSDNSFEDFDGGGSLPDLSTFFQDFDGKNSTPVAVDAIAWVDNASKSGDGTGNGNYSPDTGSIILDQRDDDEPFIGGDLFGNSLSRDDTALATQGAVQPTPTITVTVDGQSAAEDATIDLGAQPDGASLPIVVTAAGLVGATVLVSSYSNAGGVTGIVQDTPKSITSGGTIASDSAAFSIDDTLSGSISIVSSYGDGDFDINLEWTEESGGGAAAGARSRGWWRTRNRV